MTTVFVWLNNFNHYTCLQRISLTKFKVDNLTTNVDLNNLFLLLHIFEIDFKVVCIHHVIKIFFLKVLLTYKCKTVVFLWFKDKIKAYKVVRFLLFNMYTFLESKKVKLYYSKLKNLKILKTYLYVIYNVNLIILFT